MKKEKILCGLIVLILSIGSLTIAVGQSSEDQADMDEKGSRAPTFPGYSPRIHSMINQSKNSNLYSYVYTLQNFTTRETGSSGCKQAGIWIHDKFRSFGLDAKMQNFTYNGETVSNVIGILNGSHPEKKEDTYIISGHYDSISGTSGDAPGADDDGSGTALTIEAARIMSQYSFNKTIRFCAWVAEEQGLIGSDHYVNNIDPSVESVEGMYQFDMIGYADPGLNMTLHANTPSNWMLDYYVDIDNEYSLPLNLSLVYDSTEDRSDHANFWDAGYNASLAIESVFSPYYHTTDDTVDKMTIPLVTNTTKLGISTVAHLAELPPTSVEITSPGGGETILGGGSQEIKWNMSDPNYQTGNLVVDLYYSLDDGGTWQVIDTNQTGFSSPASYSWNVPENSSNEARIKLEVTNPGGFTTVTQSKRFKVALGLNFDLTSGGSNGGWHFISTKYIPADSSITSILDDPTYGIAGSYDKVFAYQNPSVKEAGQNIWEDDFEDGSVSPWTIGSGSGTVEVNTMTSNSGSYSMCTCEYAIEVSSPTIDLSSYLGAELNLWIRRGDDSFSENPESGEDFVVEYLDDSSQWVELDTYLGGGTPGQIYNASFDLPMDALHSNFQIRLSQTGGSGSGYDYWHIDDVIVNELHYEQSNSIREWTSLGPQRSGIYDTLERWDETSGIWVHMTNGDTLTIIGYKPDQTEILLKPGWNMVGYPSNTTGNNNLPTEVDKIGYFDASDPYNVAYDYDPSTFTFGPKEGYWVHNPTNESVIWQVNY